MAGRGRPPLPARQRRQHGISLRMRDGLLEKLMRAADRAGRTLSREIEHRLEQSVRTPGRER